MASTFEEELAAASEAYAPVTHFFNDDYLEAQRECEKQHAGVEVPVSWQKFNKFWLFELLQCIYFIFSRVAARHYLTGFCAGHQ